MWLKYGKLSLRNLQLLFMCILLCMCICMQMCARVSMPTCLCVRVFERLRVCACMRVCACVYWALARAELCGWALHIDASPLFTQANLLNLTDQTMKRCYVSSSRYRNDMIYRLNLPSENFVYIGWEKEFFLLFSSNFYSNFFTHFSKI